MCLIAVLLLMFASVKPLNMGQDPIRLLYIFGPRSENPWISANMPEIIRNVRLFNGSWENTEILG